MQKYLIKNIHVVNEGSICVADVLIGNGRIEKIDSLIKSVQGAVTEINGEGKYLLPGVIDDQVHFREPGLTHKANIYSESKAAVAGGGNFLYGNAQYKACSTHTRFARRQVCCCGANISCKLFILHGCVE